MSALELAPAWPYSQRNGVGVEADIAALTHGQEITLSPEDMALVLEFADDLFEGRIPKAFTVDGQPLQACSASLESVYRQSLAGNSRTLYTGYFEQMSNSGEALGGPMEIDEAELASKSLAWYKSELTARLSLDSSMDAEWLDSPIIVESTKPTTLIAKYNGLQEYRDLYRHVRFRLHDEPESDIRQVQSVLLDVYQSKVNSMTAELYPAMLEVADWLAGQPPTAELSELRVQLAEAAPIAGTLLGMDLTTRKERLQNIAWRMDYIRNGAARQPDGSLSPVSLELSELADELDQGSASAEAITPRIAQEDIEAMRATTWKADDMKEFLEAVLSDWGLLSELQSDQEQVDIRPGVAEDDKWQVIVSSRVGSLEVNSIKKIMVVPHKFNRSLIQTAPSGALPVAAHELVHVLQAEFDAVLATQIPLARIKGSKYITNREMGGIVEEREFHSIAGQSRPTNTTYVRAMQAKVSGGNQTEVARAFMEVHKGRTTAARASAAGKNIMRLYRNGRRGGHDSQVLDYAEQELVLRGLQTLPAEQAAAMAVVGGSFSLHDIAALHKIGLLKLPNEAPKRTAHEVLRVYQERFSTAK